MKTSFIFVFVILTLLLAFGATSIVAAPQEGMKIYVQWAQDKPGDWMLLDSSNWWTTQAKSDPVGDIDTNGEPCGDVMLDSKKGWIYAINVQGVTFNTCDHYGVEDYGLGVKITCVQDDPVWYPIGEWRIAKVWTFLPLAYDPRVGKMNTVQDHVVYAEPKGIEHYLIHGYEIGENLFYWADFTPPEAQYIRHGIYLSDAKAEEHEAAQTMHGWREWAQ